MQEHASGDRGPFRRVDDPANLFRVNQNIAPRKLAPAAAR